MVQLNKDYAVPAIVAGVIGFSLKSIFIKLAWLSGIPPLALMGYRMLMSVPFFLLVWFCCRKQQPAVSPSQGLRGILFCSLLYYVSSLSDIVGLTLVSVNLERIVLFTIPVFVLLISALLLKKRYHPGVYAAAFAAWLGVAIAWYGETRQADDNISLTGLGLIVISAITYAGYFILSAEEMKKRGVMTFNSQVMLISCLLALLPPLFQGSLADIVHLSGQQLKYPLLLALVSTVAPSFLMMYGVKRCGAAMVAIINNTGPFVTMLCGYWLLHQSITLTDIAGMGIVLVSVVYLNIIKSRLKVQ